MNIVYKGIEFPFRIKDSIKQRRIKMIKDTYKFYSENPDKVSFEKRKMGGNKCYYKSPEGNKCAIGRFIPDDEYSLDLEQKSASCVYHRFNVHLRKLGGDFLAALQSLHDYGFGDNHDLELRYNKILNFYK